MTKRAITYCRVSTDEQARSGTSLDTQLAACRKYAVSHGFEIVGTFKDDYTGTVPIEQRPEERKAYTMLTSAEADVLIVYSVDRLVRPPEDGDEWDILILIRGLAKVGKELHTVEGGKIETTFVGLLVAVVCGKSAGDERRKIIERSMRGKHAKANQKWVGTGRPRMVTPRLESERTLI
jgi:site-specific DNA recombinase